MAETLISPGVLARENDQSQITSQPVQAGAAIVGPTVKGQVNIPTLVTSYSEYLATFGSTFDSGSDEYSFLTSISAYNYFQNGGTSLLVTRVASGSFTAASSSKVDANTGLVSGAQTFTTNSFNATGSLGGTVSGVVSTTDGSGTGAEFDIVLADSESITSISVAETGSGYAVGDTVTLTSQSLGSNEPGGTDLILTLVAGNIQSAGTDAFVLETLGQGTIMNSTSTEGANGTLPSGSANNIRWEIVNPDTSRGVFSVVVRQGNDNNKSKSVLETWTNVSLDPKSPNYISRVIGDQTQTVAGSGTDVYLQTSGNYKNASRYVRVKQVNLKTPDYFDNNGIAKTAYTASIPTAQSGTFGDAEGTILTGTGNYYDNINNTDSQGLVGGNYTTAFNLLANKDEYVFNIISVPGLYYEFGNHKTQLDNIISLAETRGDCIAVVDTQNYGANVSSNRNRS